MSLESLEDFRRAVLQDTALQRLLWESAGREVFLDHVLRLGDERGFNFDARDVEAAMRDLRLERSERWNPE